MNKSDVECMRIEGGESGVPWARKMKIGSLEVTETGQRK
jgi:hypothetical protein